MSETERLGPSRVLQVVVLIYQQLLVTRADQLLSRHLIDMCINRFDSGSPFTNRFLVIIYELCSLYVVFFLPIDRPSMRARMQVRAAQCIHLPVFGVPVVPFPQLLSLIAKLLAKLLLVRCARALEPSIGSALWDWTHVVAARPIAEERRVRNRNVAPAVG